MRHMLEKYGEIGRLYMAPEDTSLKSKNSSNKSTGKSFTEGWVEFMDKTRAKAVAAQLNGTQMGGRRRSAYYYDLWSVKYLPKFKWDHLTEEINYEKAVREHRLAAELASSSREKDFYLTQVDRAQKMEARARAEAKGGEGGVESGDGPGTAPKTSQSGELPVKRVYDQHPAKADPLVDGEGEAPKVSRRVLRLIAGK
ncbi:hypothetical protein H632_c93p1 [Helicosporidium sp. ATCC 50920]|nr:hypothetical protein H632_c93p1 [Helicosporidium sp. ATCC 50920]|eukprot:KDD76829.1 hypothetical protein H632_c93p1 [Helicosporidium sp. ATCC 50920]